MIIAMFNMECCTYSKADCNMVSCELKCQQSSLLIVLLKSVNEAFSVFWDCKFETPKGGLLVKGTQYWGGGEGVMGAVKLRETIGMSKNVFTCKCIF